MFCNGWMGVQADEARGRPAAENEEA
eukprot:COSAG04_NODE_34560_length_107_cov_59.250000_1_plen_25_part_01